MPLATATADVRVTRVADYDRDGHLALSGTPDATVLGRLGRGQDHQARAAGRGARVQDPDPLAALAVTGQLLGGLATGLARAREALGDVHRGDVEALLEQRLVRGHEVADRRLRGTRKRLGAS